MILLALAFQSLAPAMSARMVAAAQLSRILAQGVICGHDAGATEAVPARPAMPRSVCDGCPFCGCTAAAPLPILPELAEARVAWFLVPWPIPPPAFPRKPPRATAQARAPPLV